MSYQKFDQSPISYQNTNLKETFHFANEILNKNKPQSLLDIGCASGDFLSTLDSSIDSAGVDKSKALIELAKSKVDRPFFNFDVLKEKFLFNDLIRNYGEAVTLFGTLHTFLDFRVILHKILKSNKTKLIIIQSPFNTNPIDTRVFHRDLSKNEDEFQSAYNIYSIKTISSFINNYKTINFKFIPFEMKKKLKFDEKNLMNNYHFESKSGKSYLTNGSGILMEEFFLIINK